MIKQDDLYIIQMEESPYYIKIGRSKNVEKRLKQLQTGSGVKLRLVHVFKEMGYKEKELHNELRMYRTNGEWFTANRYSIGAIPDEYYEKLNENAIVQDNQNVGYFGNKQK